MRPLRIYVLMALLAGPAYADDNVNFVDSAVTAIQDSLDNIHDMTSQDDDDD